MGQLHQTIERKNGQCHKKPLEFSNEEKIFTVHGQVQSCLSRYKKAKAKFETSKSAKEFDKYLMDQLSEDKRIP